MRHNERSRLYFVANIGDRVAAAMTGSISVPSRRDGKGERVSTRGIEA